MESVRAVRVQVFTQFAQLLYVFKLPIAEENIAKQKECKKHLYTTIETCESAQKRMQTTAVELHHLILAIFSIFLPHNKNLRIILTLRDIRVICDV